MPRVVFDAKLNAADMQELQNKLKELKSLDRVEVQKALRGGALNIVRDMKKDAPVDTGNLRNNIITEMNLSAKEVIIKALAPYSGYQEFGTIYQNGKKFFYHNVDKGIKKIIENISNKIGDILK